MNQILGYLGKAVDGIGRYGATQKLLVLFFAVLLFAWLSEKKEITQKQNRLLIYSLFMAAVLLIPITAAVVLIYQTAYYDYEWSWSMVPITAVIALGIVLLLEQELTQKKKCLLTVVIVCILCLCGNLGIHQKVSEKEALIRGETDEILKGVYAVSDSQRSVLWGPAEVMQAVRRHDGNIMLVYGRDMWDEKAGAYDYEVYSSELTEAYVWMKEAMGHYDIAADSDNSQETLKFLEEEYHWSEESAKHVEEVIKAGANTIVLPMLTGSYIEESMKEAAAAQNKEMKSVFAGEYSVYWIN